MPEDPSEILQEQVLPVLEHLSSTTPRSSAEQQALRVLAEKVKDFVEEATPSTLSSLLQELSAEFAQIPELEDNLNLPPLAGRARAHMRTHRIDAEAISAAYQDPDATWTNPERRDTTVCVKGATAVVVDAEGTVQLILPAKQVYRRRRDAGHRDAGYRRPGASAGKHQAFDTVKKFLQHAHSCGFAHETGREHGRLTHPEHPGKSVTFPLTPSDHRWWRNLLTQIRTEFGIDLRSR